MIVAKCFTFKCMEEWCYVAKQQDFILDVKMYITSALGADLPN